MKYTLLIFLLFTQISSAENWLRIDVHEESPDSLLDTDSITKKGAYTYYRMKRTNQYGTTITKLKHDCKYKSKKLVEDEYYDNNNVNTSLTIYKNQPMTIYPRNRFSIKLDEIVCKS